MALTDAQLAELQAEQPFFDAETWAWIDSEIAAQTGLTTADFFAQLKVQATNSLGILQYLLETPDEVLFGMPQRLSNQVRPAGNTITELQAVLAVQNVATVNVVNTSAASETITIYHRRSGQAAADSNIAVMEPLAATSRKAWQFALQPGETLSVRSSAGTSTFSCYLYS
jgi:hypothetical protein